MGSEASKPMDVFLLESKASVEFPAAQQSWGESLKSVRPLPTLGMPNLFGSPRPGPPSKGLTAFSTCSCILKTRN